MKVAVIGAGRNRNGIGRYTAKYFRQAGATIAAVLGTTRKSSRIAAAELQKYDINAIAYTDLASIIKHEKPDTVVISSPMETHYDYLIQCIEAGVNVFCEKPFIAPSCRDATNLLKNVFMKAEKKNLTIAMNSQWPFVLSSYIKLCGPVHRSAIKKFYIRLSPMTEKTDMIAEAVPHALSILYCGLGMGQINNLQIESHRETINITFTYKAQRSTCEVLFYLVRQEDQPRELSFGFNDKVIKREIDMESYTISFRSGNTVIQTADPLQSSVLDFISAVSKQREPLIGKAHIINNMLLLNSIYGEVKKNMISPQSRGRDRLQTG